MSTSVQRTAPSLTLPAVLLLGGQVLYILVTQLHAGGEANDHHHIFAAYAEDSLWVAVHLGQFIATAITLAGVAALSLAVEGKGAATGWIARSGIAMAAASLALYGGLQAVDGVALKHAVMAWAAAPEGEKAARFASAESVRWLEWGMRSYVDVAMGATFMLAGVAVARSVRMPRPAGWFMFGAGLAYVAQGWVAGTDGFTPAQSIGIVAGWALGLAAAGWLVVAAVKRSSRLVSRDGAPATVVAG
jgi:hypothetical protein